MASRSTIGNRTMETHHSTGFWRLDVRTLVAGVFFGIVMALLVALGDRTDTALTGGTFLIFGGVSWAAIMGISTLLCRQPSGMIAGLMEAVVAMATGASPLAPTFFVVNVVGSLAYSLVAWKLPMRSWTHHFLAQIAANVVGNALVGIGLFYILNLPVGVILVSSAITAVAGTIGGTVLTKSITGVIAKSGLLD